MIADHRGTALVPDARRRNMVTNQKTAAAEAPRRGGARLNSECVICGGRNPRGLRLQFHEDRDGTWAFWTPTSFCESFKGTVHGGIIGAVLDEAMSKAIIARSWEAFTAELRVRYRSRTAPGDQLQVHGWIVEKRRRRIKAEATLVTSNGEERAHGWGTFLVPTRS